MVSIAYLIYGNKTNAYINATKWDSSHGIRFLVPPMMVRLRQALFPGLVILMGMVWMILVSRLLHQLGIKERCMSFGSKKYG